MAMVSVCLRYQTTANSYATLNFTKYFFKFRSCTNSPLQNYNTIKGNVTGFVVQTIYKLEQQSL